MGQLLNLLERYPRVKRDTAGRGEDKTPEDMAIARQFGHDFFDGLRKHGYGGYGYSATRWVGVVEDMIEHYAPIESVLDVGCAKGFMLEEFANQLKNVRVRGVDISEYAIKHAVMKKWVSVANARDLSDVAGDKEFDLVVSINTVHNLGRHGCIHALEEIERIGKQAYITVDAYSTDEERERIGDWNLTALTILHDDEWLELFAEAGYSGDYGFWRP